MNVPSKEANIESILLTTVQIKTFYDSQSLTNATGFFFASNERLFLVSSRHVFRDEANQHLPNAITISFHLDLQALDQCVDFSVPLYKGDKALWRQGEDGGGEVDLALIELDRAAIPQKAVFHAFTPEHVQTSYSQVEVGTPVLAIGFPLGFHDMRYKMPVARQAIVASSFGTRFQGLGYFLTDGRMHRGISGAPVVMRMKADDRVLPWRLLGVHASKFDVPNRDANADDELGLNAVWYADMLLALTEAKRET